MIRGWFYAPHAVEVSRLTALGWIEAERLSLHWEYVDGAREWWRCEFPVRQLRCMYNAKIAGEPIVQGEYLTAIAQRAPVDLVGRRPSGVVYVADDYFAYLADGNHRTVAGIQTGTKYISAIVIRVPEPGWRNPPKGGG